MISLVHQRKLPKSSFLVIVIIRLYLTILTPKQIQRLMPNGETAYHRWVASKRKRSRADTLVQSSIQVSSTRLTKSGGVLHWLGASANALDSNSRVLLFFHGGGYAAPISDGHISWCYRHISSAREAGIKLCVAILQYRLIPDHKYPTQLRQAAEGLEHILSLGIEPSRILIGGDSAGGNLTFGLLGHLLHPHPEIDTIRLSQPIAGAFGVSPWVTMDMNTASYRENGKVDMLSSRLIQNCGNDLLVGTNWQTELSKDQCWSMPLNGSTEWWSNLSSIVPRVFLSAGKQEIFRDHVLEFAKKLESINDGPEVMIDVGEKEAHDHILVDFLLADMLRNTRDGRAAQVLMKWSTESLAAGSNVLQKSLL
jgi:acetyl esterase/lipase